MLGCRTATGTVVVSGTNAIELVRPCRRTPLANRTQRGHRPRERYPAQPIVAVKQETGRVTDPR